LANEQYFSLTTNQPTILSAMAYQPSEQSKYMDTKQFGKYNQTNDVPGWQQAKLNSVHP